LIAALAAAWPVRWLCRLFGVNVVSYYRSLKQVAAPEQASLAAAVKEVFWRHSRRYGSRRIHAELKAAGVKVGRHVVRRLMREQGLQAIQPRSFVPRTTASRHTLGYSPNLLQGMKLPPERPREIMVGDITYLPLATGGFAYLATWTDLFSRKVVGWAVEQHMEESLIIEALALALGRSEWPQGAIVHSDRGGQYGGKEFRRLLAQHGLRQSMSRAGESYDNPFAESFFSRYKAELLEGGLFSDVVEARLESFNYIEGYYNGVRRHSSLGYVSPEEYERQYAAQRAEAVEKTTGAAGRERSHSEATQV